MYSVAVYGGGEYLDSDKEMAYLEAKRWSVGQYLDTEVWVFHNDDLVRKYYNGHLSENYEELT
jgi:hypothetical protein